MKTLKIKVYSPAELKKKNPDAFESAWEKFRYNEVNDIPWSDEIIESLKAVFDASGINLRDYSISGDYPSQSWVRFDMESDVRELSGQRALAWIENNLLSDLREKRTFINRVKKYDKWHDFTKYGEIPSCPFTGYCADDDFIDALLNEVKNGETLEEAYQNLAYVAGKLFEGEIEYITSEEYFLEQEHFQYTIDGHYQP